MVKFPVFQSVLVAFCVRHQGKSGKVSLPSPLRYLFSFKSICAVPAFSASTHMTGASIP